MSLVGQITLGLQAVGASVKAALARIAALESITINAQTGTTYSLVLTDAGKSVECANAAAIAVTVPTNASQAFKIGAQVEVIQAGAGQVTITPASGVTLKKAIGLKTRAQESPLILRKVATDTWRVMGDAAA